MKANNKRKTLATLALSFVTLVTAGVAFLPHKAKVYADDGTFSPNDLVTVTGTNQITENHTYTSTHINPAESEVTGLYITPQGYAYDWDPSSETFGKITSFSQTPYTAGINGVFSADNSLEIHFAFPQHKNAETILAGTKEVDLPGNVTFCIADVDNPENCIYYAIIKDEGQRDHTYQVILNSGYDVTADVSADASQNGITLHGAHPGRQDGGYSFTSIDDANTQGLQIVFDANKTMTGINFKKKDKNWTWQTSAYASNTGIEWPTFKNGYTISVVSRRFFEKKASSNDWDAQNEVAPILLQRIVTGGETTSFGGTSLESEPTWYTTWKNKASFTLAGEYQETAYDGDVEILNATYVSNGGETGNATIEVSSDGGETWTSKNAGDKLSGNGTYIIKYSALGNEVEYAISILAGEITNDISITVGGSYKPTYLPDSKLSLLPAEYIYVGTGAAAEAVERAELYFDGQPLTPSGGVYTLSEVGEYTVKYTAVVGAENAGNVKEDITFNVVATEKELIGESIAITVGGSYGSFYPANVGFDLLSASYVYESIEGSTAKTVERIVVREGSNTYTPVDGKITLGAGSYDVVYTAVVDGQSAGNELVLEGALNVIDDYFDMENVLTPKSGNPIVTTGYTATHDNGTTRKGLYLAPEGFVYNTETKKITASSDTPFSVKLNAKFTQSIQIEYSVPLSDGADEGDKINKGGVNGSLRFVFTDVKNGNTLTFLFERGDSGNVARGFLLIGTQKYALQYNDHGLTSNSQEAARTPMRVNLTLDENGNVTQVYMRERYTNNNRIINLDGTTVYKDVNDGNAEKTIAPISFANGYTLTVESNEFYVSQWGGDYTVAPVMLEKITHGGTATDFGEKYLQVAPDWFEAAVSSIKGANLVLADDLAIKFYVAKADVEAGKTVTLDGVAASPLTATQTVGGVECYVYIVEDISPDALGVKHILKVLDGEAVVEERAYSVADYCYNMINKNADAKLTALCKAILNYGAAAQNHSGVNADALVNATLSEVDKVVAPNVTVDDSNKLMKGTLEGATADITGASLFLDNSIKVKFYVEGLDENSVVRILVGGVEKTTGITVENGVVEYAFESALDFDKAIHVAIFDKDGNQISAAVQYSVKAYCFNKVNDEDEKTVALVKAIYNYVDCLSAYGA